MVVDIAKPTPRAILEIQPVRLARHGMMLVTTLQRKQGGVFHRIATTRRLKVKALVQTTVANDSFTRRRVPKIGILLFFSIKVILYLMYKYKKGLSIVEWQDAAYSFEKELPPYPPIPNTTYGLIVEDTSEHINIATNVHIDSKNNWITLVDGFLIPKQAILKIEDLSNE